MQTFNFHPRRWTAAIAAGLLIQVLAASPARALNVGYYDMCYQQGRPSQATAISNAGHTPVNLTSLTPADLAPVDVIFVDNCDNSTYDQAYVDHVSDIADAVAGGKVLVLHDRYVDLAETILPGGSSFDIERYPTFPDPNNEAKDINVLDASTLITNGPAGSIDDSTPDGGNFSNHGFAIAGSLPGTAKLVLSTSDPTHIVTFLYTYGAGAVMYSSIPLDYYLDGNGPNANFRAIYAVNVVDYAAYLVGACGNGIVDPGEDCDLVARTGHRERAARPDADSRAPPPPAVPRSTPAIRRRPARARAHSAPATRSSRRARCVAPQPMIATSPRAAMDRRCLPGR